jgi:hypothetical protein
VRSTPEGAVVTVDGTERGVTPLSFTVPIGETAIDVAISHEGYETVHESLVPNEDGRIVVALPAVRPAPAPNVARPSMTGMAARSPSPFRRFN